MYKGSSGWQFHVAAAAISYLLSGSIPHIELHGTPVGVEGQGVDFHSQSGHILLFEFSSQVTLDKGGLADSAVTDENELEFGNLFALCGRESGGKNGTG